MDETKNQPADEPELVGRLLREAGPRPDLREDDVATVLGAARFAWELRRRRARSARLALALAAGFGVLAIGFAWWRWQTLDVPPDDVFLATVEAVSGAVETEGRPLWVGDRLATGAAVRTPGGGRAALRLADGAALRLDEDTRLTLAATSAVTLERGGLYVDTGSAAGAGTIEVHTPFGSARDIGTRFLVRIDGASRHLLVAVRDGAVEIEREGRMHRAASGEELSVGPDGLARRLPAPAHGPAWDWVLAAAPPFPIEGRTLGEYLDWLQRESGWNIRFSDPALGAAARRIVLHGDVVQLAPQHALDTILAGAGYWSVRRDAEVVIDESEGGGAAD